MASISWAATAALQTTAAYYGPTLALLPGAAGVVIVGMRL